MLKSNQTKEIILGSLLGDSSLCIHKGYANARLSFRHSVTQSEYFYWKVSKLQDISSGKSVWIQSSKFNEYGVNSKLRFQSRALKSLTDIHTYTTFNGMKSISSQWLKELSPLSLAVWWMDDGSVISNRRKGVFCTDNFSVREVILLRNYLETVWNIRASIGYTSKSNKGRKSYPRLFIYSINELRKFFGIITDYVEIPSMRYKLDISK